MPKGYQKGRPDLTDEDYKAKLVARCTVTAAGCWEINGFRRKSYGQADDGYGLMCYRGKAMAAHRLSYLLHKGPLTPGLDVMHSCDNPPCCNPEHLSEGTRRQNIRDSIARRPNAHVARINKDKTHCPRGHAFADHGRLQPNKGGWVQRACVVCQRASVRKRAGWPEELLFAPKLNLCRRPSFPSQRVSKP